MEISITIDKAGVMAEVAKTSAYIGAKARTQDGGNLYGDIAATKEDEEMLGRYWEEACSNVAAAAKDFVTDTDGSEGGWTATLGMPEKYNEAFTGVLQQRATSYVVSYIVACWLLLCGMDAAVVGVYRQDAALMLGAVQDILYARNSVRPADNAAASNSIGTADLPDFGSDGDGEEMSGSNSIGGDTPQNFGPTKAIIKGKA